MGAELTPEEKKARHDKLVRSRPCKQCVHFMPLSSYHCSSECNYDKDGWEPIIVSSKGESKRPYTTVKGK